VPMPGDAKLYFVAVRLDKRDQLAQSSGRDEGWIVTTVGALTATVTGSKSL